MLDQNHDMDEHEDPQAKILQFLHIVSQNLDNDDPDFVDAARKLESLENVRLRTYMSPAQDEQVTELRRQATDQFEQLYEKKYYQAQQILRDTTLSFKERIEKMRSATDPLRWAADNVYFRNNFHILIKDKYDALRNIVELLIDDTQWPQEKRTWLHDYIEVQRTNLHEKDTKWLRDTRLLVESFLAQSTPFNKEREFAKDFFTQLRQQEAAQQAVTTIGAFRTLFTYALSLPALEKLADDASIILDGTTRTKGEALSIVVQLYHSDILGFVQDLLKKATGLDKLENYAKSYSTQPFDPKQSFDELHRLVGRAWIALDPQNRQTDKRVSGYFTLASLAAIGDDDLLQTVDGLSLLEATETSLDGDQIVYLPEVNSKLLSDADRIIWKQLESWINDLFKKIDDIREDLKRIQKGQMPSVKAAPYLVKEVLPYSTNKETLEAWDSVQEKLLQEYENRVSEWENNYIVEITSSELDKLREEIQASPIRMSEFSKTETIEKIDALTKRIERLKRDREKAYTRIAHIENQIKDLQDLQRHQKWQEGELLAKALRIDLEQANYLTTGQREAYRESIDHFLVTRDTLASESDMEQLWQETLSNFDDMIAWETLLSRYKGKKYHEHQELSMRFQQYRFAEARCKYLKANALTVADTDQGLTRNELIEEAHKILLRLPGSFYQRDTRLGDFKRVVDAELETVEIKNVTKQRLAEISAQIGDDSDLEEYRRVFEELRNEPGLDSEEQNRFLSDFAKNKWTKKIKEQIKSFIKSIESSNANEETDYEKSAYNAFSRLRSHIQIVEHAGFWSRTDNLDFITLVRSLSKEFKQWHEKMTPSEASLFGTAFDFIDYENWIDKISEYEGHQNDHEIRSYGILALYEPEANTVLDDWRRQTEQLRLTIDTGQVQLSSKDEGNQAKYQNWLDHVLHSDTLVILFSGLIYATTRLIEGYYRAGNASLVKELQNQMHKDIVRTRVIVNPDVSAMRTMWEHWLATSRIYHAKPLGVDDASILRDLYANYFLGNTAQENAREMKVARPYWVRACSYAWEIHGKRIESRLLESIGIQFRERGGNDPNELAQFLEYFVIVKNLREKYEKEYPDTIRQADEWEKNNQANKKQAKKHYQQELDNLLYADDGLRSGLFHTYERAEQLKARVDAVVRSGEVADIDNNPSDGIDGKLQTKINNVTRDLRNAVQAYSRLSENLLKSLKEGRDNSSRSAQIDRNITALQRNLSSLKDANPLPPNNDGSLDPLDIENVSEYKLIKQLSGKVKAFYDLVKRNLNNLSIFSPPENVALQKHFKECYEKLSEIADSREGLNDYLESYFTEIFPDEPQFKFDLSPEILQTKLRGHRVHLPDKFVQEADKMLQGLDKHLELLESLTEKADKSRKALKDAKQAFQIFTEEQKRIMHWGKHFISCHIIINENRIDISYEDSISNGDLLPERYTYLGPFHNYLLDPKKENQHRSSDIPIFATLKQTIEHVKESWKQWIESLTKFDSAITPDTRDEFKAAFVDFIDKVEVWLQKQKNVYTTDNSAESVIYRKYIYNQNANFDKILREIEDLRNQLDNNNFGGEIIAPLESISIDYGKLWDTFLKYVTDVHARFTVYMVEIDKEIRNLEDQDGNQINGGWLSFMRKPHEIDNTDEIATLKSLRDLLRWDIK